MKKIQISIDDNLLDRIDTYADNNYLTRSGFITLATSQFLNTQDVTKAIKDMAVCMQKISDNADKGTVTKEMLQELEDFNRIAKMLYYGDSRNIKK